MKSRHRWLIALGGAGCAAAAFAAETITYTYDPRGRLVLVQRSGTVNNGVTATYGYDRADNRTNVIVSTGGGGGLASIDAATPDAKDCLEAGGTLASDPNPRPNTATVSRTCK